MARLKFTRIPVRTSPSGNEVSIPVYFFKGKNPKAKKAYLQSSIHGAELQGNAVIFHLIEYLKKNAPLGDVTLVPLANPVGMDRKTGEYTDGRFDTVTGENWNRAYWNAALDEIKEKLSISQIKERILKVIRKKLNSPLRFAEKLALTLQEMAMQADCVLDLHNANESLPYLYSVESALPDALYLGFPHIISMPPVFGGALDETIFAPWAKFQKQFALKDSEIPQGYTLELGSHERVSFADGKNQTDGILEYLKHQGVITGRAKKPEAAIVADIQDYKTIYAGAGGLYDFKIGTGSVIKKGAVIAEKLSFLAKGGVKTPVLAPYDFLPTLRYSSGAVNEGDELFKGFVKWRTLRA
jgi:predicted deacylase